MTVSPFCGRWGEGRCGKGWRRKGGESRRKERLYSRWWRGKGIITDHFVSTVFRRGWRLWGRNPLHIQIKFLNRNHISSNHLLQLKSKLQFYHKRHRDMIGNACAEIT